jgi:hypothetical protein
MNEFVLLHGVFEAERSLEHDGHGSTNESVAAVSKLKKGGEKSGTEYRVMLQPLLLYRGRKLCAKRGGVDLKFEAIEMMLRFF